MKKYGIWGFCLFLLTPIFLSPIFSMDEKRDYGTFSTERNSEDLWIRGNYYKNHSTIDCVFISKQNFDKILIDISIHYEIGEKIRSEELPEYIFKESLPWRFNNGYYKNKEKCTSESTLKFLQFFYDFHYEGKRILPDDMLDVIFEELKSGRYLNFSIFDFRTSKSHPPMDNNNPIYSLKYFYDMGVIKDNMLDSILKNLEKKEGLPFKPVDFRTWEKKEDSNINLDSVCFFDDNHSHHGHGSPRRIQMIPHEEVKKNDVEMQIPLNKTQSNTPPPRYGECYATYPSIRMPSDLEFETLFETMRHENSKNDVQPSQDDKSSEATRPIRPTRPSPPSPPLLGNKKKDKKDNRIRLPSLFLTHIRLGVVRFVHTNDDPRPEEDSPYRWRRKEDIGGKSNMSDLNSTWERLAASARAISENKKETFKDNVDGEICPEQEKKKTQFRPHVSAKKLNLFAKIPTNQKPFFTKSRKRMGANFNARSTMPKCANNRHKSHR